MKRFREESVLIFSQKIGEMGVLGTFFFQLPHSGAQDHPFPSFLKYPVFCIHLEKYNVTRKEKRIFVRKYDLYKGWAGRICTENGLRFTVFGRFFTTTSYMFLYCTFHRFSNCGSCF